MNQKAESAYLAVIVLALAISFAAFSAVAKNDNAKSKSNKSSEAKEEKKDVNFKNYAKPDVNKGQTNAQFHKEKTLQAVNKLENVAKDENKTGDSKNNKQIQVVAQEQERIMEENTEAIAGIEDRGKVKTLLFGSDYKNLGQLRSNLVHNRNQIRTLTRTMNQMQVGEDKTMLEQQLETLMQERERIKAVITANEEGFSLFGWVSRFLFNYEQTPINDQEESDLADEVEEAIEGSPSDQENIGIGTTNSTAPATTPVQ